MNRIRTSSFSTKLSTLLSAALSAGALSLSAAHAADLPERQAGLWEMSNTIAEMGGMGMSFQICVDDNYDDMLASADEDADCDKETITRQGNRFMVETRCRIEGSEAHMRGEFSGDFKRDYRGEVLTTYTPPLQGMSQSTMTMQARWLGPCAAGQQAGDIQSMQMPGLGNLNLQDMMQNMPDPAQLEEMQKMLEQMQNMQQR